MSIYHDELKELEKKKQTALFDTASKSQDKTAASANALMPDKHQSKSAQTAAAYKSAYRQILEHDFTSQAWIGKKKEERKHRKNINSNYKTVTGRKWSGLSEDEKNTRKDEFETRRSLSLKASGQVADLLTKLNQNEAIGPENDMSFLKEMEDINISRFMYAGDGTDPSSTSDDQDFLKKFEENMPMLHRALSLYEKLHEKGSFPELQGEARTALMAKLAYMKEVRSAYEDRIRIISSPYYVSLREKDFVGDAPEYLEELQKSKKTPAPLRSYAASVLRWRNKGLSILQKDAISGMEIGQRLLEEDIKLRKKAAPYASDNTIDGIMGKIKANYINAVLNDKKDYVAEGMPIKTVRSWVYADLKKKISAKDITARLHDMQDTAETEIKLIEADPEKYREDMEKARNKDFEKKKKDDPDLQYKVVTAEDVSLRLKKMKKASAHLKEVSKRFAAGEFSLDVMKLWLDRGLQHDLRMGRQIYDNIVFQNYSSKREQDKPYKDAIDELITGYFQNLPEGIVTVQSSKTAYIRKEDAGKVDSKKALGKKIQNYPEHLGIIPDKSDFIHIIGGKVKSNEVTTRAYISTNQKYKSKAVEIFMKTVTDLKLQDHIYFKIVSQAANGRYGMDDITVFFTENVSLEDRTNLLDTFYKRCNEGKEKILEKDDMCVTAVKYRDGIALAPEPSVAETLNTYFCDICKFNETDRLKVAKAADKKVRGSFSFNTFITSMFCQSAITANYQMGKSKSANINVGDKQTLDRIKTIFRQLCFLNGVDPQNMT